VWLLVTELPVDHLLEPMAMPQLTVFSQISLDGYFVDAQGDMRWAHKSDAEWQAFVEGNVSSGSRLLFGRVTYAMMAGYWPTPMAAQQTPVVARLMNELPKVVFSRTLTTAGWNNTQLICDDMPAAVRAMKSEPGPDLVILGSGSIVAQLTDERLIDEYQLVVNPIVLGEGRTPFAGVREQLSLRLAGTRTFGNGNVLLCYRP
jgi:dihydrofolate reductase